MEVCTLPDSNSLSLAAVLQASNRYWLTHWLSSCHGLQNYRVLENVGEGTYGVVVKCLHKATGTFVAIKEFKDGRDKERVTTQDLHGFAKPCDHTIDSVNLLCIR